MLVWLTGCISIGVAPTVTLVSVPHEMRPLKCYRQTSVGPLLPALIGALTNFLMLALFIFTAGPISGAHFNPLITIGTFFAQLTSLPRAALYVAAQSLGAVIGGYILRASVARSRMVPVRKHALLRHPFFGSQTLHHRARLEAALRTRSSSRRAKRLPWRQCRP